MTDQGAGSTHYRAAGPGTRATSWVVASGANANAFRATMGRVIAGVTVITTRHDDRPWGMTVSAFTPVCMDPPTLLICVNTRTITASDITLDRRFGVNLLSQSQLHLSQLCSSAGESKFLDDYVVAPDELPGIAAMPVLRDSIVTFDCRATDILPVGTHSVVIGTVEAVLAPEPLPPLLYGEGRYLHGVAIDEAASRRDARA